ncbi:hypothetical protein LHFGNBLO_000722 [Mesorhizobium sp. AR10]|uniref:hypothetical protein n=1 Tax=Mesorhizobium sp. AR10 TaxID=2865839 RepID=UPI00215FE591|nr:hypothetical protein [Mesorhizobium sp. AR10]UVK39363.1 hypothetical protein LHFGNBLO_000722 [Mesorhizobium sp. AR10]
MLDHFAGFDAQLNWRCHWQRAKIRDIPEKIIGVALSHSSSDSFSAMRNFTDQSGEVMELRAAS